MKTKDTQLLYSTNVNNELVGAQPNLSPHARFLASMSHELRTPLNGIIGCINLLMEEENLPRQQEHINTLKHCSQHMLSLINDLLDYGKIGAGQLALSPAPFNLAKLIAGLQSTFERQFVERSIGLTIEVSESLDRVFISDEMRLTQVLINLVSNALKFTREGAVKCVIKARDVKARSTEVYFMVEDTGIGISGEHQHIIFDAFRQAESSTKKNFVGTGIGLTISKKLVDMFGGNLEVESKLNEGSKFHFTLELPHADQDRQLQNDDAAHTLNSLAGYRVLIADDSHVNRQITRRFLQKWGVIMDEAKDGREAVNAFYKNKYDVLLIDLHMPEMDGYEVIEAIRKMDAQIPAFAFTAAVLPDLQQKLKTKGFTDLLQKPFKPQDLHQKLMNTRKPS